MHLRIITAAFIAPSLAAAAVAFGGATVIVPVSEDESVLSFAPDKNYGSNLNRGGLFVGADGTGTGVARFYIKFALPADLQASDLSKASLAATYLDDLDPTDNGTHKINFVAADNWTEDTITWDNQPGPTFGTAEATFDARVCKIGDVVKFDVTGIVREQLEMSDRTLSLMFAASNESTDSDNRNWEYFSEREFDPNKSFFLALSTSGRVGGGGGGGGTAIPLPAAAWPAMITLAGAVGVAVKKRVRRK